MQQRQQQLLSNAGNAIGSSTNISGVAVYLHEENMPSLQQLNNHTPIGR
jgi:hypothetical protein